MAISDRDIKKLWGLAAGRCSRPGCEQECLRFLDSDDPTIIGEMAHIIAKKPGGPRGQSDGGEDTYGNLILLCPTHHTEIDKAQEGVFPAELLYEWKSAHEKHVRDSFLCPRHPDRRSLASAIKRLLIENETAWRQYGPESAEARRNPISNLADVWQLRKLDTVVPNNRRIIHLIAHNRDLIDLTDYTHCVQFIEHAEGFERSCYTRTEGVPRFPVIFEKVIDEYVRI